MTHQQQYTYLWGWTAQPRAAVPTSKALCYCAGYSTPLSPGSHSPHNTLPHPLTWKCWTESTPWNRLVGGYLCSNFCLCVCLKLLYSIAGMYTGHSPVPWGAVDITEIKPRKEVESVRDWISEGLNQWGTESVRECTVNGQMHLYELKPHNEKKKRVVSWCFEPSQIT